MPYDLRGIYPEDPDCPGLSETAIDVGDRVQTTFIWERHPWKLEHPGVANYVYPGVDFLLAYWLGRYYGFVPDDAVRAATRWRTLPPPALVADGPRQLLIPSVTPTATGASVRAFYLPVDPEDETLSGLGLRMHWDSFAVQIERLLDLLPQGVQPTGSPISDILDLDGDPATDYYLELSWISGDEGWPGVGTTPALLFRVDLLFSEGFAGTASLGFSPGSEAQGFNFAPWRVVIDTEGAFSREVQQMYVGYYGRPGDPAGVSYWVGRMRAAEGNWGPDLINAFGFSAEYTDRFGGLEPEQLIDTLYQQMFNRSADPVGKAFYLDLLAGMNDSGLNPGRSRSTPARIALDIANGARDADRVALANKLDVAAYFTTLVDENDRRYLGEGILDAAAILTLVGDDPSTIVWQILATDGFIVSE